MWRTFALLVLTGFLLVAVGGNAVLFQQAASNAAEADQLRARARAAEEERARLEQRLDELDGQNQRLRAAASPAAPAPTASPDRAVLQRIQDQVVAIRGLRPRSDVPLRFLDHEALRRYLVQNFERDYLPAERESDQKLLTTLGLLDPSDNLAQLLLDLLQEQVIGVYSEHEKVMYIVGDQARLGPEERETFAHEFTHALQDQYYDLERLAPKHPDNDDRALAVQALIEGDAVLVQRLWAQDNLSPDERNRVDQGGGGESKLAQAPLAVRQQLLFPYVEGFSFVRQVYQQGGGYAGVDELFRNPPESTEQILHPDSYRAHKKPLEVALPDLAAALGEGWRRVQSNVLGELQLRSLLEQHTDRARAVRGASGWAGDRWELLERDDRQAVVLKTTWDTDDSARTFFDTFGLGLKNRFAGGRQEEGSTTRQALTASTAATELRIAGRDVLAVVSFDRPSAEAIVAALGG